jgi:hypothetical protein
MENGKMGFNDYDDDFYSNTENDPDFYDTVDDYELLDNEEEYDDSMDGDTDSALGSCGWGTDEYYGYFGDDDA